MAANRVIEPYNASVNTAATATVDVDCSGYDSLTVVWQLMATVTTADLSAAGVKTYRADGTTIVGANLPTVSAQAAVSDGTNVVAINTYDVRGLKKVRVQATNGNAGAKVLVMTAYLGRPSI